MQITIGLRARAPGELSLAVASRGSPPNISTVLTVRRQVKQGLDPDAHFDFGHQLRLRAVAGFQHEYHVRGQDTCSAARLDEGEKSCRQVETDLQGIQAQ